jgi:hypothetical protein
MGNSYVIMHSNIAVFGPAFSATSGCSLFFGVGRGFVLQCPNSGWDVTLLSSAGRNCRCSDASRRYTIHTHIKTTWAVSLLKVYCSYPIQRLFTGEWTATITRATVNWKSEAVVVKNIVCSRKAGHMCIQRTTLTDSLASNPEEEPLPLFYKFLGERHSLLDYGWPDCGRLGGCLSSSSN